MFISFLPLNESIVALGLVMDILGAMILAAPEVRWLQGFFSRLPIFRSQQFIEQCLEGASNIDGGERIFRNDLETGSGPVSESVFDFWCESIGWATGQNEIECEAISRHPNVGMQYTPKGGIPDEDTVPLFQQVEFLRVMRDFDARRYRIGGLILLISGFALQLIAQIL